jgi:hypothetical protein
VASFHSALAAAAITSAPKRSSRCRLFARICNAPAAAPVARNVSRSHAGHLTMSISMWRSGGNPCFHGALCHQFGLVVRWTLHFLSHSQEHRKVKEQAAVG